MMDLFDFRHAEYVLPSYLLAVGVIAALAIHAARDLARWAREAKRPEETER